MNKRKYHGRKWHRQHDFQLLVEWHVIARGLNLRAGIVNRGFDPRSDIVSLDRTHEPYARLYNSALDHPKFRRVGMAGWAFFWAGVSYSRRTLGDGFVPKYKVMTFFGDVSPAQSLSVVKKLVKVGFWKVVPGGFLILNWPEYQNTKAEVEHWSQVGRENVSKRRDRNSNPTDGSTDGKGVSTIRITKRDSHSLSHSLSVLSEEDQQREVDIDPEEKERPEVLAAKEWSRERLHESRNRETQQ